MLLIAPVAIILVAENLGHIKAVTAMTGRNLDAYMGRAFIGDGVATMVSGGAGGTGVTTYAENIGVMAATKIYSTAVFVVAALIAVVLGFSPKFGAVIQAIPLPVMGGVSIVVFGLIAVAGAKIWVDNRVDFSDNRNLIVAAITLVLGTGDFTLKFGGFALGGIGTATFGAILLYAPIAQPGLFFGRSSTAPGLAAVIWFTTSLRFLPSVASAACVTALAPCACSACTASASTSLPKPLSR
jgi:putative pyrimidine permease RutG